MPRGDHADDALRLELHFSLRAEQAERESGPPLLALRPARHMLFRVLERADRGHDVGHQRLVAAAVAEILAHRLGEILRMIDEHDRKSTRLNSSHYCAPRMPSSACTKKKTLKR